MSRPVSWNLQLGLAVTLFVLGSVGYWVEYKHKPEKEASEEQARKIFQVKETPIQSIRLVNGPQAVTMNCLDLNAKLCKPGDTSKWEVTEPLKFRGDDSNVNALVSTLNSLSPNETIELKDETPEKRAALLKDYGLDPESRKNGKRVEVTTTKEGTVLFVGGPHPIGDLFFALEEHYSPKDKPTGKPDENKVFLIPNFFKSNLDHDVTHWRDKKILTMGVHEVESFQYQGPKGKFSADRKEGKWTIHDGKEDLAGDVENVDNFLTAGVFVNAKGFASEKKDDAKAQTTLKGYNPTVMIALQKEKGSAKEAVAPITFTLYEKKGAKPPIRVFATVSNLDPLFEIEPNSLDRLTKTPKELRMAKLITSMERFNSKRLEFSGKPIGDKSLTLASKDGKWVNSADSTPVSLDKVTQLLDKLSGNRIKDFLSGSAIPAGEADGMKVSIGDEKEPTKRQFSFWKKEGKLYGKDLQSKRNEAYLIDSELQNALPWTADFFKETPPPIKPEDLKKNLEKLSKK